MSKMRKSFRDIYNSFQFRTTAQASKLMVFAIFHRDFSDMFYKAIIRLGVLIGYAHNLLLILCHRKNKVS